MKLRQAGGIATIPGGVEHEGWCHEDAEVIDIFAPSITVCQDFSYVTLRDASEDSRKLWVLRWKCRQHGKTIRHFTTNYVDIAITYPNVRLQTASIILRRAVVKH